MTVPETFDDLVAFCGEATEKGYIPIAFGNNPGWEAFHQFSMTGNQMIGPEAMRALLMENQGSWDTPEITKAIEAFFVTLRDAGCFPDDANAITYDDGNSLFFSGEAFLHTTGSWLVGDIVAQHARYGNRVRAVPGDRRGPGPRLDLRRWIGLVHLHRAARIPTKRPSFIDYAFSQESPSTKWFGDNRYFVPVEIDMTNIEVDPLTKSDSRIAARPRSTRACSSATTSMWSLRLSSMT